MLWKIQILYARRWRRSYRLSPTPYRNIYNVSFFLRWTLLKIFSSIRWTESTKFGSRAESTGAVINTSNEVKCPLLWEFWIYNFSRRILERVFVVRIVNIRNECLFSGSWEWIVARNKQIDREPLRGSRDLFVPRYDSFPWTQKKRHSFLIEQWKTVQATTASYPSIHVSRGQEIICSICLLVALYVGVIPPGPPT